ncbi:MAG: hypothetical protein ACK4F7_10340 [Inhella sp.]
MKRSAFLLGALVGHGLLAPRLHAQDDTLVLRGEKIYLSPEQPPLRDGGMLIRGGRIDPSSRVNFDGYCCGTSRTLFFSCAGWRVVGCRRVPPST